MKFLKNAVKTALVVSAFYLAGESLGKHFPESYSIVSNVALNTKRSLNCEFFDGDRITLECEAIVSEEASTIRHLFRAMSIDDDLFIEDLVLRGKIKLLPVGTKILITDSSSRRYSTVRVLEGEDKGRIFYMYKDDGYGILGVLLSSFFSFTVFTIILIWGATR